MSFIDLHSLTVSNFNSALKVLKWRPASTLLWTSSCSYLRPITVQLEKHLVPRETPVSLQKSNCKSRFGETWRTPNETRNVVTTPFHISLPTTPRWLSWFPAAQLAERSISGFILIQSCIGLGFACRCTDYLIVQKKRRTLRREGVQFFTCRVLLSLSTPLTPRAPEMGCATYLCAMGCAK